MDKAPAYGAGDSEFEPRFGYKFLLIKFRHIKRTHSVRSYLVFFHFSFAVVRG